MTDEIAALAKTLRGIRKDVSSLDARIDDAEAKLETLKTPPKAETATDDDGNPFK